MSVRRRVLRRWLAASLVIAVVACGSDAKPATTDPLEALAQCVRDAGLADATDVDSDEAKHAMWLVCPELVEHP